jgi:transposase
MFKRDNGIRYIFNTPKSPDMSPIENIWNMMEEKFLKYEPIPVTTQEKEAALEDIWLPRTAGLARTTSTGSSSGSTG